MDAHDTVVRWWPMGKHQHVVLDPGRSWGRPLIERNGTPTRVITRTVSKKFSREQVADWFQLSQEEVDDALAFESLPGDST